MDHCQHFCTKKKPPTAPLGIINSLKPVCLIKFPLNQLLPLYYLHPTGVITFTNTVTSARRFQSPDNSNTLPSHSSCVTATLKVALTFVSSLNSAFPLSSNSPCWQLIIPVQEYFHLIPAFKPQSSFHQALQTCTSFHKGFGCFPLHLSLLFSSIYFQKELRALNANSFQAGD